MKLTKDNYFSLDANRHYMSVSQFKGFLPAFGGCESKAMAELAGEYERPSVTAFMEGHFVHAWNEGTLDEFKANNPDLYASTGKNKGQLKSNFQHCNLMIDVLEKDPFVTKALAGQKEVILTADMFGIPWKVMLDSYQPAVGVFADLKCMRDMDGKHWNKEAQCYENFIEHYGYDIQISVYAEIERRAINRENWLIPNMVIVTKQDPPDHDVLWFDYELIEQKLLFVRNHIDRVIAVKTGKEQPIRCETCDYCRSTKLLRGAKHYGELAVY
ncbi:MAG TPA: PD-(D/E)XK nuclease-like domain-containing protein [Candidatus Paenibacillus intestinavium]|nr:PD-(D/E)XK nuclease-like domain-containing protein [Candidatus Paenibacillus intestinavium]